MHNMSPNPNKIPLVDLLRQSPHKKKTALILIIGVLLGITVGYFIFNQKVAWAPGQKITGQNNSKQNEQGSVSLSQEISIDTQIPGEVVLIKKITMPESGWLAIHDDLDGKPGKVLGAAYLKAGTHQRQEVLLLRALTEDKNYLAVIHKDDGDRYFDYLLDAPLTNPNGQLEVTPFSVVVSSPRGE